MTNILKISRNDVSLTVDDTDTTIPREDSDGLGKLLQSVESGPYVVLLHHDICVATSFPIRRRRGTVSKLSLIHI